MECPFCSGDFAIHKAGQCQCCADSLDPKPAHPREETLHSSELVVDVSALRANKKWIRADGCAEWPIGIDLGIGTVIRYLSLSDWIELHKELTEAINRRSEGGRSTTGKISV